MRPPGHKAATLFWYWWIFGGNTKASMLCKPSCICWSDQCEQTLTLCLNSPDIVFESSCSYCYCVCINTNTVKARKTVLVEYGKDVRNPALVCLDSVLICEASLTAHILLPYSPHFKNHISVSGPEKQLNVVHLKLVPRLDFKTWHCKEVIHTARE